MDDVERHSIINLTILECKYEIIYETYYICMIINLTILECKSYDLKDISRDTKNNKSNHIGM